MAEPKQAPKRQPATRPPEPGTPPKEGATALPEPTMSERFLAKVQRDFSSVTGGKIAFSPLHTMLGVHMFLKIDASIAALNVKRQPSDQITWKNINLTKLAIDTAHRCTLELDALVKNHIHVVPYKNGTTKQFDIDLRIGYEGVRYVHMKFALDPPLDIVYKLVYANDVFEPKFKTGVNDYDSYVFNVKKPFDRGEVVGGFAYIAYPNPAKNRLEIYSQKDFDKAMKSALTKDFWQSHPEEMKIKTIVHRICSKILLDPVKINAASLAYVQASMNENAIAESNQLALDKGNKDVIDASYQVVPDAETTGAGTNPSPEELEAAGAADNQYQRGGAVEGVTTATDEAAAQTGPATESATEPNPDEALPF